MLKNELARDIEGFEGFYKITNFGNVISLETRKCDHCGHQGKKQKFLKAPVLSHGYKSVSLCRPGMGAGKSKGFSVHRLVAIHFVVGRTKERDYVNHKDGNKLNNHADNLEWVTASENGKHATAMGLNKLPEKYNAWHMVNGKKIRLTKCEARKQGRLDSFL